MTLKQIQERAREFQNAVLLSYSDKNEAGKQQRKIVLQVFAQGGPKAISYFLALLGAPQGLVIPTVKWCQAVQQNRRRNRRGLQRKDASHLCPVGIIAECAERAMQIAAAEATGVQLEDEAAEIAREAVEIAREAAGMAVAASGHQGLAAAGLSGFDAEGWRVKPVTGYGS
ncbi:hypothetical protein [Thermodesulfitimonas autotrophica]|nr:hypothetical protein [Thermodesulfitimonas autotrophica]